MVSVLTGSVLFARKCESIWFPGRLARTKYCGSSLRASITPNTLLSAIRLARKQWVEGHAVTMSPLVLRSGSLVSLVLWVPLSTLSNFVTRHEAEAGGDESDTPDTPTHSNERKSERTKKTNERTSEQTSEQTNERTNERANERTCERTITRKTGQTRLLSCSIPRLTQRTFFSDDDYDGYDNYEHYSAVLPRPPTKIAVLFCCVCNRAGDRTRSRKHGMRVTRNGWKKCLSQIRVATV